MDLKELKANKLRAKIEAESLLVRKGFEWYLDANPVDQQDWIENWTDEQKQAYNLAAQNCAMGRATVMTFGKLGFLIALHEGFITWISAHNMWKFS